MDKSEAQSEDLEMKQLVELIMTKVAEANAPMMDEFLKGVVAPMLAKMDGMALAQVNLMALLRQSRRDRNATEFAKVLLEHRAITNKGKLEGYIDEIGLNAYQLADRMEEFALVSELQASGRNIRVAEMIEEANAASAPDQQPSLPDLLGKIRQRQRGKTS